MWRDLKLAVIDCETTGLDTKNDRIIEIAILCYEGEKLEEKFETLVNPMCEFNKEVLKISGIKNEELLNAPAFGSIISEILERIEDRILVAYNAEFDKEILKNEFLRNGGEFLDKKWIDPLILARGLFKEKRNKLSEVAERIGINVKESHRAGADALLTAEVLFKMSNLLPQSLDELLNLQREWEGEQKGEKTLKEDVLASAEPSLGLSFIYGNPFDPDPLKAIFSDYPTFKPKSQR